MLDTSQAQRGLSIALAGVFSLLMSLAGCSDGGPVAPDDGVEITDEINTDIHTDGGNVGVVIDVRDIFKKGYVATSAEVTFQDYPEFSAALDIDPATNLAILSIEVDSLTAEQEAAFAAGVVAHIGIYDANQVELASFEDDRLVLDDSNLPLSISTDLPHVARPVALRQGIPYLLQLEAREGLVTTCSSDCVQDDVGYTLDDPDLHPKQQFYFTAVDGEADTYFVEHFASAAGSTWRIVEDGSRWLRFTDDADFPRADLVLEQDEDGWVKMRLKDTVEYLQYVLTRSGTDAGDLGEIRLTGTEEEADRFRLISDNIDWQVVDRGTVFNQPIMSPAKLDFAYKGTLRNCSGATLEETIGKTEGRTRTTTVGTSESLQMFSSAEQSFGVKIGYEVKAKIGADVQIGEASSEVTMAEEVSFGTTYTTSQTAATENTWSESKSTTTEVSRTRTLTLPPFTAVEAYDAVKTIDDVRVPFTQMVRITATYEDDGAALSGDEIQSQMLFNLVDGVVSRVGDRFVDISIRGQAVIDQLFEATTNVSELPDACN